MPSFILVLRNKIIIIILIWKNEIAKLIIEPRYMYVLKLCSKPTELDDIHESSSTD